MVKRGSIITLFVDQPDLSLLRDLVKTGATRKFAVKRVTGLRKNNDTTPLSKLQRKTHNIAALKIIARRRNNYMPGVASHAG